MCICDSQTTVCNPNIPLQCLKYIFILIRDEWFLIYFVCLQHYLWIIVISSSDSIH